MAKIEYLLVEREHIYGDKYRYYASGYGFHDYEPLFFSLLADDGWEMISDNGSEMRFKRIVQEESYGSNNYSDSYYDDEDFDESIDCNDYDDEDFDESVDYNDYDDNDLNENIDYNDRLDRLENIVAQGFVTIDRHLAKLQTQNAILTGLVQDLVEKLCPDSEFLSILKKDMGLDINSLNKNTPTHDNDTQTIKGESNSTVKQETFLENDIISGFADEHIETVMNGYQDEDKSISLFAVLVGFGSALPRQTTENHHRYMIKALYRYYTKNQDEKIANCYVETLNMSSIYLSSPATLKQLNELANSSMTIVDGMNAFFNIVISQLDFEKEKVAPFEINQMSEFIKKFIEEIKNNKDLYSDNEFVTKIREYLKYIKERYDLEFTI